MGIPKVETYRFGEIVIDGRSYRRDVIIFPDRVRADWWRIDGHSLAVDDLREVTVRPPATLIVGQGAEGRLHIPDGTRQSLEEAGISVIAATTGEAVELYNAMRAQGAVVAALHLTC